MSVAPDIPRRSSSDLGNVGAKSSAVLNKLTSVLSASYADRDIRDALEALDHRKVQNTAETRRQLRMAVQGEVIQCNAEIIDNFGLIAEQLDEVGSTITALNKLCEQMKLSVSLSKKETSKILEQADELMAQRQQVQTKQLLLDAFRAHFIMSEEEVIALTASSEPVDDRFFEVLARTKKIHKDCQVLLESESQKLGRDIMDQSSRNLEAAYNKLYRWVQKQFKGLDMENPQINSSIRQALRAMAERPSLFRDCLSSFAEAREQNLTDVFHEALTGTTATGEPTKSSIKPIELYAHDPLRYLGDMMAWAHSVAVSEREALEVFFITEGDEVSKGIKVGLESEPWSHEGEEEAFDGKKALDELVNRNLSGVSKMLRQRVEQVIQSHEESTLAYQIANLVGFYRLIFKNLLGVNSNMLEVLSELEHSALRQFKATMRDHVELVQRELPSPAEDLTPPKFLEEALEQLRVLMKSFDASLAPSKDKDLDFSPILAEALDPFLDSCSVLAKDLKGSAQNMFIINYVLLTQITLKNFEFCAEKRDELNDLFNEQYLKLVDFQYAFFLSKSGLQPMVDALNDSEDTSSAFIFEAKEVLRTAQTLDHFLPSAMMEALENLTLLRNAKLAKSITGEASERFCTDFDRVEAQIIAHDKEDGADDGPKLRQVFPRTGQEIRVLLS